MNALDFHDSLKLVENNGTFYRFLNTYKQQTPVIARAAIANNPDILNHIHPNLRNNEGFIRSLFNLEKIDGSELYEMLNDSMKMNEKLILDLLDHVYVSVSSLDHAFIHNKAVIMKVLTYPRSEGTYKYLGPLKHNPDIIRKAIVHDPGCFEYVPRELHDLQFIIECVKISRVYPYLPPEYKACREITVSAIQSDGNDIEYVPEKFKLDPKIVKSAFTNAGEPILHHLPAKWAGDYSFMLDCIEKEPLCYRHASECLKRKKEFITKAIVNAKTYLYIPDDLKDNKIMLFKLLKLNKNVFRHIEKNRKDEDIREYYEILTN